MLGTRSPAEARVGGARRVGRIAGLGGGTSVWVTIRKPGLVAAVIQPVLEGLARTVLEAAKG